MGQKIKESIITPAGVLAWTWLEKPDTSPMGKNKYKTAILLPKGVPANDALAEKLNALHKQVKGKRDKAPVKCGDAYIEDAPDAETATKREAFRGHWFFTAKSNKGPKDDKGLRLVDAGRRPLAKAPSSGDLAKLAIYATDYAQDGSTGVTLYLNAVQLLERRNHGRDDGFGDESDNYGLDNAAASIPEREQGDESDESDDEDGDGGNF